MILLYFLSFTAIVSLNIIALPFAIINKKKKKIVRWILLLCQKLSLSDNKQELGHYESNGARIVTRNFMRGR